MNLLTGPVLLNSKKRKMDANEIYEVSGSKQPRLDKLLNKMIKFTNGIEDALKTSSVG